MKKYVYALAMLMPHLIIPCAPSQSGQRVWDIATKNIFITQSIESSLDEVTSIDFSFSNLDQLLDKVTIVTSKASYLLQEINYLQNNLIENLSQTEQIQSNIELIENNFALLDISGIFTALDALQTTVVSAMDLLNTDLEIIESNIGLLTASEIQYFQVIASQLDKLDEDVVRVNSLLEALSTQFSLTTFDSITDLVHQDLIPLESNVALLADQIATGFAGTFSVLDQNLLLVQTIESMTDSLDVMNASDLTDTYSLLDQLDESMQTIDSLTDLLIDTFQSIESSIDISESALDKSVSKYVFIESRVSLIIQKIQDMIIDPAFSHMDHASSLLDQDISLLENAYMADLPALTGSIESKLDHIIEQQYQQIMDFDIIASVLDAVIDIQNGTIISKLEIANSLLDDTIDDVFATESYLDPATHSEQLLVIVDNAQDLQEQLSYVELVVPDISSKMTLIDDLLVTTDSTLDIVNATALNNVNDVIGLESMVDTLSFVAQPSDSITSTLDIINSQEDVVISKLDTALQLIETDDSQAQGLISDFQATWTVLQAIDTKLVQAYSSLSLTDAAIDAKFVSYSSVFTMIDTIIANEGTVNSQVDVYNSMVNVLTNTINVDFNGMFTALTSVNASVSSSSSTLSTISSKLSNIQTEFGFPIYQTDIPLTITTPGRYYLAENITYSGASNAITINTNNVSIDLNNRTLQYTGASTISGILINGASNVSIFNGTISGFSSRNIETSGTLNSIRLRNLVSIAATSSTGMLMPNVRNLLVYNCNFYSGTVGLTIQNSINMYVHNCGFVKNSGISVRNAMTNLVVSDCTFQERNTGTQFNACIALEANTGTRSNYVLKNCFAQFINYGIYTGNATSTGLVALNNTLVSLVSTGFRPAGSLGVIKNNTIINSNSGVRTVTVPADNYFIGFNSLIQNTGDNINVEGANTYLGNFAFNTNASGSPAPSNYTLTGSDITGKFVTISQRTGISGSIAPTYWHNINMLP